MYGNYRLYGKACLAYGVWFMAYSKQDIAICYEP